MARGPADTHSAPSHVRAEKSALDGAELASRAAESIKVRRASLDLRDLRGMNGAWLHTTRSSTTEPRSAPILIDESGSRQDAPRLR